MEIYQGNREYDIVKYIEENDLGEIQKNAKISDLCSIRCGGIAKYLYSPKDTSSLIKFLNYNQNDYFILGNGTNVLASSKQYDGIIIHMKKMPKWYVIKNDYLYVSASYSLVEISYILAKEGYGNLEFYNSIPGTIGGAVFMNAGAFGHETKDYLEYIVLYDCQKIVKIKKEDIIYEYRKSNLEGKVILSAVFKIKKTDEDVFLKMKKHQEIRKRTQPLDMPSCGSVFKNPKDIYAWELIDDTGFRGYKINNAMVSIKHANFIVTDNAKGEDVLELIMLIIYKVYKKHGIFLENEIIFFNF